MDLFPLNLDKFHVSLKLAFLLEDPLEFLPEYFQAWNCMAKDMATLVKEKQMREAVHQMSGLDYTRLTGHREYRLAHLQLSIIAAGYIWQDGDGGAAKVLPRCLAEPLCRVSAVLGLQPVLLHATLVLANWKIVDNKGTMKCLYEIPGGAEADWFITVTAQVELSFAAGLENMLLALYHAQCDNVTELTQCLHKLKTTLLDMKKSFSTMHDKLTAETFYNVLRPFLTGWGGEGSPLPGGLIYEGVSDSPVKMIGGSAAQSCTWQTIDAVLGSVHKQDIQEFLQSMRHYMPPAHKEFIVTIETHSKVKQTVTKHSCDKLTSAYNDCVQAVMDFRSYHIQIVTKYIVIEASKKNRNKDCEAIANKGTGGSSILPFLKSLRSTTSECLLPTDSFENGAGSGEKSPMSKHVRSTNHVENGSGSGEKSPMSKHVRSTNHVENGSRSGVESTISEELSSAKQEELSSAKQEELKSAKQKELSFANNVENGSESTMSKRFPSADHVENSSESTASKPSIDCEENVIGSTMSKHLVCTDCVENHS